MAVKISIDRSRVAARIKAGKMSMIAAVAEQALSDSNEHCKFYTGDLRKSSATASDPQNGLLVWNTPYARRQYYTGTPNTSKKDGNPKATLQWCETARNENGDEWQRIAQREFTKGMG